MSQEAIGIGLTSDTISGILLVLLSLTQYRYFSLPKRVFLVDSEGDPCPEGLAGLLYDV